MGWGGRGVVGAHFETAHKHGGNTPTTIMEGKAFSPHMGKIPIPPSWSGVYF